MKSFSNHPLQAVILTLVLTFSVSVALHAAPEKPRKNISQQQAVSIAQQTYPGRVLAVKRKDTIYQVKTLSDNGEVRIIQIDASSGKVISGR